MEPIGAAYAYESTLDHDELILIGDFGGGTSDFSLLHVGPTIRKRGRVASDLLGNSGLGLAGDAFDARIVRKLVSPALGSEALERTFSHASDRPAPIIPAVPAWIYANLERWHYLSFLKTRNVTEILRSARARAQEPEKVAALITLIEEDLGYQLHQAVQRLKIDLSHNERAEFRFRDGSMDVAAHVDRADFESWIADDLAAIEGLHRRPARHRPASAPRRSTASSSPAAPASSPPSAASSRAASPPSASAPATSSPRSPAASPSAPTKPPPATNPTATVAVAVSLVIPERIGCPILATVPSWQGRGIVCASRRPFYLLPQSTMTQH